MKVFERCFTDKTNDCCCIEGMYAGDVPSAIWIVGAGPSLKDIDLEPVRNSAAPVMGVNFAGRNKDMMPRYLKPTFWTTYDSTTNFMRSTYMDPSIIKFVNKGRSLDIVPGGTGKLCDCPGTVFIQTEVRGYKNFLDPSSDRILNARDSYVQAIDIAFRLGFRKMYLIGADLRVCFSGEQKAMLAAAGILIDENEVATLQEYETNAQEQKVPKKNPVMTDKLDMIMEHYRLATAESKSAAYDKMDACEQREEQYAVTDIKPFAAAVTTDDHYWRTVQYLRLAKRNLAMNGVELISCTPASRLNSFFRCLGTAEAEAEIYQSLGMESPGEELTFGMYHRDKNPRRWMPYTEDIEPYGWKGGRGCCGDAKPVPVKANGKMAKLDRFDIKNRFDVIVRENGEDIEIVEQA